MTIRVISRSLAQSLMEIFEIYPCMSGMYCSEGPGILLLYCVLNYVVCLCTRYNPVFWHIHTVQSSWHYKRYVDCFVMHFNFFVVVIFIFFKNILLIVKRFLSCTVLDYMVARGVSV